MPPTRLIVSALPAASEVLTPFVSPIAAPAAARMPARMATMPTATSQPKKAEPQLMPPNSSRWRLRISCAATLPPTGPPAATAAAVRPRWLSRPSSSRSRSRVATPPRSSAEPSSSLSLFLKRSNMKSLP